MRVRNPFLEAMYSSLPERPVIYCEKGASAGKGNPGKDQGDAPTSSNKTWLSRNISGTAGDGFETPNEEPAPQVTSKDAEMIDDTPEPANCSESYFIGTDPLDTWVCMAYQSAVAGSKHDCTSIIIDCGATSSVCSIEILRKYPPASFRHCVRRITGLESGIAVFFPSLDVWYSKDTYPRGKIFESPPTLRA